MTYIFGHRGASGYAPENTLEAFQMAIDMHADGIELDVQFSKDNEVVICHDETIDRTSDHQGRVVDYTLSELKSFNFNNNIEGYDFCQIPTLDEILALIKPTNLIINIELKTSIFDYPKIEEKVIALVEKYQMEDRIIYSSFNHYSIQKILQLRPNAYCGFLHTDWIIDVAEYAKKNRVKALHPGYWQLLDPKYLIDANRYGLLINTWTVNDDQAIIQCLNAKLNCIITNYPDKAIMLRDKQQLG